jgi:hypothetical protein
VRGPATIRDGLLVAVVKVFAFLALPIVALPFFKVLGFDVVSSIAFPIVVINIALFGMPRFTFHLESSQRIKV